MPVKLCSEPGCRGDVVYRSRCAEHAWTEDRAQHPNRAVYNSLRWKRLRRRILFREPLCRECARHGREALAADVDHIVPIEAGGAVWDKLNLQPLCKPCHGQKTKREMGG